MIGATFWFVLVWFYGAAIQRNFITLERRKRTGQAKITRTARRATTLLALAFVYVAVTLTNTAAWFYHRSSRGQPATSVPAVTSCVAPPTFDRKWMKLERMQFSLEFDLDFCRHYWHKKSTKILVNSTQPKVQEQPIK